MKMNPWYIILSMSCFCSISAIEKSMPMNFIERRYTNFKDDLHHIYTYVIEATEEDEVERSQMWHAAGRTALRIMIGLMLLRQCFTAYRPLLSYIQVQQLSQPARNEFYNMATVIPEIINDVRFVHLKNTNTLRVAVSGSDYTTPIAEQWQSIERSPGHSFSRPRVKIDRVITALRQQQHLNITTLELQIPQDTLEGTLFDFIMHYSIEAKKKL
jgi:hypothetical protein